jgi:outer membrane protein assembly factor BamB
MPRRDHRTSIKHLFRICPVCSDNFLSVYRPAETGYDDVPGPGWRPVRPSRPGKLALRLIAALIVGVLAGAAIILQVKGWGTLGSEAGGACGTSKEGVSYGACPRGITPALITSFIAIPVVVVAVILLFRSARRGFVAGFMAVGVAGGLLAGHSLFGIWHGTDLTLAWAADYDSSSDLSTVGAWTSGDSLIRVRVDEAVSYDAATGEQQWTLQIPGLNVACGVSGMSSSGTVGLIAYGQDSSTCDHVMAVDLATGRQLWSDPAQSVYRGNGPTGALAVASGTAIVLTGDGIAGVNDQTGVQKWTLAPPAGCGFQELAASGASAVALAACDTSYYVVSIDPATGKAAWRSHVTEPSDSYQFQILSASPVVIDDDLTGPRGTSTVRVFGSGGTLTSSFSVSGIPLQGGTVALNTGSTDGFTVPAVVADGMLVGVTDADGSGDAIVGYRLADGRRQWLVYTPDQVHDVALSGGELVYVDESQPAYSLEEVGVATGTVRSFGYFSGRVLQSNDSGLYAVGRDYLVVNLNGDSLNQAPVAAVEGPAPN